MGEIQALAQLGATLELQSSSALSIGWIGRPELGHYGHSRLHDAATIAAKWGVRYRENRTGALCPKRK